MKMRFATWIELPLMSWGIAVFFIPVGLIATATLTLNGAAIGLAASAMPMVLSALAIMIGSGIDFEKYEDNWLIMTIAGQEDRRFNVISRFTFIFIIAAATHALAWVSIYNM